MPKIKIATQSYAGEEITSQVTSAAQSENPNKNVNGAVQVRDSNGKVVQVMVNLPESDAAGVANACSKIDENPGVSKCARFPQELSEDFESGSDGNPYTNVSPFEMELLTDSNNDLEYENTSPIAGTLSGEIKSKTLSSRTNHAKTFTATAAHYNNKWSSATHYEVSAKVKFTQGANPNDREIQRLAMTLGTFSKRHSLVRRTDVGSGTNWHIQTEAGFTDTGVPYSSGTTYEYRQEYNANTGESKIWLNGVLLSTRFIGSLGESLVSMSANNSETKSSAQTTADCGLMVDDVSITIFDALL